MSEYVTTSEERSARVDANIAKQLQRSIEINCQLRIALEKAALRFEAKGMQSDAYECRRTLREV